MGLRDYGNHRGHEYRIKKMRGGMYRGIILDDMGFDWKDRGGDSGKHGQAITAVKEYINNLIENGKLPSKEQR